MKSKQRTIRSLYLLILCLGYLNLFPQPLLWSDSASEELEAARQSQTSPHGTILLGLGSGLYDGASEEQLRLGVILDPIQRLNFSTGFLLHDGLKETYLGVGMTWGNPETDDRPRLYGGFQGNFIIPVTVLNQGLKTCFGLYGLGGAEFPLNHVFRIYFEFGGGTVISSYDGQAYGNGNFLRGGMNFLLD